MFDRICGQCRPGQEAAAWTAQLAALGKAMPRNWNRALVEARARDALLNFIENGFLRLSPGMADLIGDLSLSGLSPSVITDGPKPEMEAVLMARGDRDLFEKLSCLCGAEDLALPEIGAALERAADTQGLDEDACLLVSARGRVLERGQQLGFRTLSLLGPSMAGTYPWHGAQSGMMDGETLGQRIRAALGVAASPGEEERPDTSREVAA